MNLFKRKIRSVLVFFGFSATLVSSASCLSTQQERQDLTREIFASCSFDKIYEEKSLLGLLPAKERKKYLALHKDAVVEFYAKKLTWHELKSLAQFQDEPAIQRIRKSYWAKANISQKNIDEALAVADMYPIIKKISSEQFQNELSEYVLEKVFDKSQEQ